MNNRALSGRRCKFDLAPTAIVTRHRSRPSLHSHRHTRRNPRCCRVEQSRFPSLGSGRCGPVEPSHYHNEVSLLVLNTQVLFVGQPGGDTQAWAYGLGKRGIYSVTATVEDVYDESSVVQNCGLIVVDIDARHEEIISVCAYLRTRFEGPILLFTYEHDERFQLNVYQAGIDECIIKPIGIQLALAKIMSRLQVAIPEGEPSTLGRHVHRRAARSA